MLLVGMIMGNESLISMGVARISLSFNHKSSSQNLVEFKKYSKIVGISSSVLVSSRILFTRYVFFRRVF